MVNCRVDDFQLSDLAEPGRQPIVYCSHLAWQQEYSCSRIHIYMYLYFLPQIQRGCAGTSGMVIVHCVEVVNVVAETMAKY